jgi:putative ABC transport system ATP-binding protein
MSEANVILRIDSITKTYPANGAPVEALRGVSLELAGGQFAALRGTSGCGKSTLLLTAGGLLRPDRGHVVVGDQDLYAMPSNDRAAFRARHIGFVFQQFHLVPYLTVLDNVLTATLGLDGQTRNAARKRALELVEQFGLTPRIRHRPAQLSTGERQRTALARALLNRPTLVLADEPTGNLDQDNARIVLNHLRDYALEGAAVLLVTHDPSAAHQAQLRLKMTDGQIEPDDM